MAIKEAVQAGNSVIRAKAKPVKFFLNKKIEKKTKHLSSQDVATVRDLVDSMRHNDLVGMAAPQIGKSTRIFISEIKTTKKRKIAKGTEDPLRIFINPKITSFSKKKIKGWEGCGSVVNGQLFAMVNRPESVTVKAFDEKGIPFTLDASGLLARIIQHELDHLDGILFTDKADPKTYMSLNEYLKYKKHLAKEAKAKTREKDKQN